MKRNRKVTRTGKIHIRETVLKDICQICHKIIDGLTYYTLDNYRMCESCYKEGKKKE